MGGVEPADSGVAHQRVTATLHLLGGPAAGPELWIVVGAGARSTTRSWVGWESNPRFDGVRVRCKASVCYRPESPHPLESNQNLAGFSRARRPTTQEWEVPAAREHEALVRRVVVLHGCLPGHPSSSLFGCQRPTRGARGAPRASRRASPPRCTRDHRECTTRVLVISIRDHEFANASCRSLRMPASVEGPKRRRAAWSPWRPVSAC